MATYVPNSGDKLQRLDFRTQVWDKRLQEYLKSLEASGKPVRPPLLLLLLPPPPPPPPPAASSYSKPPITRACLPVAPCCNFFLIFPALWLDTNSESAMLMREEPGERRAQGGVCG